MVDSSQMLFQNEDTGIMFKSNGKKVVDVFDHILLWLK